MASRKNTKAAPASSSKATKASRTTRTRSLRLFPAHPFQDVVEFAKRIHDIAPDGKVRKLTLFEQLDRSPSSSASRDLITSANKYRVIEGGYQAEFLTLTSQGLAAVGNDERSALIARFELGIKAVEPFSALYDRYKGKRLADKSVLRDSGIELGLEQTKAVECVDLFITNLRFLGLIRLIAGAETLVPLEQLAEEKSRIREVAGATDASSFPDAHALQRTQDSTKNWDKICFYITAIGADESEERKHSDLFLKQIVTPALDTLGLEVVRADQIGQVGLITSQVIEHVFRSRLVIADLSFHNPNVFYEIALRHASCKPIVHISRKCDRLPFDVAQSRTVIIDTSSIFTLIPQLDSYKSEIAAHARAAISEAGQVQNVLTTFFPHFDFTLKDISAR